MALFAIMLSLNFVACSDDDDNDSGTNGALAGTTWKVVSVTSQDEEFDDYMGHTATLYSNGTITFSPTTGWTYAKWELNGDILKFTLGEGHADDYLLGKISINGNKATWNCYWEDVDGKWSDKDDPKAHAIIILEKQ